jgi:hypothetical protein
MAENVKLYYFESIEWVTEEDEVNIWHINMTNLELCWNKRKPLMGNIANNDMFLCCMA